MSRQRPTPPRRLFIEPGHNRITTAEIIRAAGISNGSFFHAFASKIEVARAVWEQARDSHAAVVISAFEEHVEREVNAFVAVLQSGKPLVAAPFTPKHR